MGLPSAIKASLTRERTEVAVGVAQLVPSSGTMDPFQTVRKWKDWAAISGYYFASLAHMFSERQSSSTYATTRFVVQTIELPVKTGDIKRDYTILV